MNDEIRYGKCYSITYVDNGVSYAPYWEQYSPFGRNWLHFRNHEKLWERQKAVRIDFYDNSRQGQIVRTNQDIFMMQMDVRGQYHNELGYVCMYEQQYYDYWNSHSGIHMGNSNQRDPLIVMKEKIANGYSYGFVTKPNKYYIARDTDNDKSVLTNHVRKWFRFNEIDGRNCQKEVVKQQVCSKFYTKSGENLSTLDLDQKIIHI